jgi:chromosome segregation ATPase
MPGLARVAPLAPARTVQPFPQATSSLAELSGLLEIMREQADRAEAKMDAVRKEAGDKLEAQRQEAEAKLEAQRKEAEDQKKENETLRAAARPRLAAEVIGEEELLALQTRLQAMHEAKLLTDEELFCLEDAIVDCIEVLPTAGASSPEVDKVVKMMLVSAKVPGDAMLARQLRRKFV